MKWLNYLKDVWNLFFPDLCALCLYSLERGERVICTHCHSDMPYTDYHTYKNNPLAKQMWGRVWINAAASLLYYRKGGTAQKLIHQIKYKGNLELGYLAGKILGSHLSKSRYFRNVDCIVPVPLHRRRLRKRGYNQSSIISKGIADVLKLEIREKDLVRLNSTTSQTNKNRQNRFENMVEAFAVNAGAQGKHILLVDDVITTGATIEACAQKLLEAGAASVSIATLAYTE